MDLINNKTNSTEPTNPWDGVVVRKAEPAAETPVVEETPIEPNLETPEAPDDNNLELDHQPSEVETDEDKEPNPYFYLAGKLKADGFLLDEAELTESVSGLEVYDAYRKKLEAELEPRIKQQVYNQLESEGVTAQDLVIARAIRQGIDTNLLSEVTMHERYGSLPDKTADEEKLNSIRAMYRSRKFTDKEIERLVSDAADDEELLNEYFGEAKTYHKARWQDFQTQENERVARSSQQQKAQLDSAEKLVNKIFSTRELLGEKMTEQESAALREAIYSPTDRVEIQGQEYTVSKLYRFNYELENNPELKLWLLKKYLLKDNDLASVKKEVAKEMEDDMLKAYEASVKKDLEARRKKELAQKIQSQNPQEQDTKTRKSWMVEF